MLHQQANKSNRSKNFDIKYGIIDINTLTDYIDDESIDFIITDPPYGGLVQYLDLSSLWLIWLEKFDARYKPDFQNEITIKRGIQNINLYKTRFQNGISNLFKVLKPNGKIVFTFHNKNIAIWNAFLNAVSLSGFKIEKVIHQQNRRSGESNVSMPYGTSSTDFYIRCIKSPTTNLHTDSQQFEHFIITKAISLIGLRNEPTPFQILFDGLLSELSIAGFDIEDYDLNIQRILSKKIGKIFSVTDKKGNAGNYWWFIDPKQYIRYPDRSLSDRVDETILSILRKKVSVKLDDVIAEIFVKYPNGLTPDIKSIDIYLNRYAHQSGGRWVYNNNEVERIISQHSEMIYKLCLLGKKLGYKSFIGKREQPEIYNGHPLSSYAEIKTINFVIDPERKSRIEMIDLLWINNEQNIVFAFEVENTTNFTSGIQRGSNLEDSVCKLMVIPNDREQELNTIRDPMFIHSFRSYNWRYINYSDLDILISSRHVQLNFMQTFMKDLYTNG